MQEWQPGRFAGGLCGGSSRLRTLLYFGHFILKAVKFRPNVATRNTTLENTNPDYLLSKPSSRRHVPDKQQLNESAY